MDNKIELKVNVINQLKLLRQSTFKDTLCFLDEDVQNAQRAKAKYVKITTDYYKNTIIIENDGVILNNPQALFSIAESGWGEDIKKAENPFGTGFFSNISVSSLIEIYSGNKHIIFNIDKMIQSNDTEIFTEDVEEHYNGFKLILNNFNFSEISQYSIKERVEMLGKYVHDLDIYYNGIKQEKKDLTQGENNVFEIKIEESECKGWLALSHNYWSGDNLNIFYKGRLVCKLDNIPYINGDIHIDDRTLNLTSPDRKDIIKDNKYLKFREDVKEYVKLLCEDALLNGQDGEIEEYADAIAFYIDKEKVKDKMKFVTFKSKKEEDLKYLKNIALVKKKDKNIKSFEDYHLYLDKESSMQSESHFEEVVINEEPIIKPEPPKGIVVHGGSSSYFEGYTEKPEIKEKETEEKFCKSIISEDVPTFWLTFDEVVEYERNLNIIRHYDLKIIIARNKIESEILKGMKESHKILHLGELNENVELVGYLSNTNLSLKEQRALMLFNLISKILSFNHNIFSIGDLMVMKKISVPSLNITSEVIEDSVVVLRNKCSEKVYVDRSIIDLSSISEDLLQNLTLDDYKFILTNLNNIVKQVMMLCDGKKTEDSILRDIVLALGQGRI